MKRNFFAEWYHRLQQATPIFFNKIAWLGGLAMAAGSALEGAQKLGVISALPERLDVIAQYAIVGGMVAIAIAKAAVTNGTPDPSVKCPDGKCNEMNEQ